MACFFCIYLGFQSFEEKKKLFLYGKKNNNVWEVKKRKEGKKVDIQYDDVIFFP